MKRCSGREREENKSRDLRRPVLQRGKKNVHFLFSILKAAIDTDDYFTLAWLFLPPFHRGRNSRKEM